MISSNFEIIGQFWCALFLILNGLNQLYNRYCELVPPLEIFFLLVFVHVYSPKNNNKHVNCFISIFKPLPKLIYYYFFVEFIFLKRNGIMLVTTINNILKKKLFPFSGRFYYGHVEPRNPKEILLQLLEVYLNWLSNDQNLHGEYPLQH